MPRTRRWSQCALAGIAVVVAIFSGAGAAGAVQFPEPDQDPFYAVPPDVGSLQNGAIIRSRETTSTIASVPVPAKSWQVLYKTIDALGQPTATVTTVMVPTVVPPPVGGPRPLVSYQIAEDGLGTRCAPSYGLREGATAPLGLIPLEATIFTQALAQGWTVVTPDYQGPKSQYFGAEGTARGVLDGIRAARAFAPAAIDPKAPTGLWGYSAGANATIGAAQLQPSYAPELKIAGAAYGGVVPDVRAALHSIAGGPLGGNSVLFLAAVDRSYPEAQLQQHLSAFGKNALLENATACATEISPRLPLARIEQFLDVPGGIDSPVFDSTFKKIDPITFPGVPAAPVYDYRGTIDEVGPLAGSRVLADRFCRAGVPVQKVEFDAIEHVGAFVLGAPGALRFLDDRFAGRPPTSTCGTQPQRAAAAAPTRTCAAGVSVGPVATIARSRTRLTRRRITVRGRATGGCDSTRTAVSSAVVRTTVVIARQLGPRCRFLTPKGRFTTARSCTKPVALRARGTRSWIYSRATATPRGRYRITVRAVDRGGRTQSASATPYRVTVR